MKIERIQIDGFGCHKDLMLAFNEDFNILYGKNESGKSTVLAFIQTIFYGFDDTPYAAADRTRTFWAPWQGGPFGGTLTFNHNGQCYTVMASWGRTQEEDRISVQSDASGKTDIVFPNTVGDSILQITRSNFETFVLGATASNTEQDGSEAEQLYAMTHTDIDCPEEDSIVKTRLADHQKWLESQQSAGRKCRLAMQEKKERLLREDAQGIQLATETADLEAQHAEMAKQETKPQSLDALTMSVALLEKQKKVHKLYAAVEDLRYQYAERHELRRKKKLPWTIVMIVCLVLDVFALVTCLIPIKPILSAIGLASLSATAQIMACVIAIILFLALSLGLIILRTAGKRDLYALEEALQYREQSLCELLSLEDGNPEDVIEAIDLLNEQCKNATQCLAAIDRDRKDKAELSRKLSECMQQITYNRARQEISARLMTEKPTLEEMEEALAELQEADIGYQKHLDAIKLTRKLLSQAQARQKSDLAPRLSKQSGALLGSITQGRYRVMELSRDFEPAVAKNGVLRGSKHYRGATGKQINLALKLSQLKLLADAGKALPFILDEPFSGYDEERRAQSTNALLQFAKENNLQILITSSDKRSLEEPANNQYALSI